MTDGTPPVDPHTPIGRDYGVIKVDDNTIKLGGAFNGGALDSGGPFSLPAGTSGIDPTRDVIVFGGPHHFVTGDAVIYDNAGGTFGSVATNGQRYFVRVIDDRTIRLTTTLAAALATPTSFSATAGGLITSGNELNLPGFANGDKVTYRAPSTAGFSSAVVDAVANESDHTTTDVNKNEIYIARDIDGDGTIDVGHGFQTGDRVTYRTNGAAIGGLVDGVDCFVIKLDDRRIQLALTFDATNPDDDGNGPHVGVTPINLVADKSDAGKRVKHALLPQTLTGLVNGATYTVVSSDADTFRLRDSNGVIVPTIAVGSATGTHFLSREGIELNSGGGTDRNHTLRIDITGTTPGAVNLLLGAGGVSLRQISPPTGDGQSSASAQGGSGGAISVDVPTANATFHADVQASVDAALLQAGGDVTISSKSDGKATAYANSASGGFAQVGAANSHVEYSTNSNAYVGHAAPGKTISGITSEQGSPQVIASGVHIDAGGHLKVTSQNGGNATVGAGAAGGGFISVSVADASPTMTGQSNVLIGSGATIDARTVDLDANVNGMRTTATSQATAGGFAGGATAKSQTNTNSKTLVLIEGTTAEQTHINAPQGMDVSATHTNVVANRSTDAHWYGLFGGAGGEGNNNGSVGNLVDADAGVIVTVAPRPTAATTGVTPPGPLDTFPGFNHLALLGKANNDSMQSFGGDQLDQDQRAIHWDADVVVGGGPAPELVVDATGHIVRATNVTVNCVANPVAGANAVGANGKIEVADIVNDDLGEIVFQARSEISGGNQVPGHFWGTFTFDDGFDTVRLTNESNSDLVLNTIDVINANGQPHVHLDRGDDDVSINFAIDRTVKPSLVDVRNLGRGDIVLRNGKRIENPIGETRILNAGDDIVADAAGGNTYIVRTGALGDAASATLAADFERETRNQRRYQGSIAFAANGAAPDTLMRVDGTSWTAGGFVVGDLVKIEVAGQPARVVQIAGFTGANAQTAILSTQATHGSLVDGNAAGDVAGVGPANVTATHVDLDANGGGIGTTDNDLDVNTGVANGAHTPAGRLYAEADQSIDLTETAGELNVLAVRSFGGDVRLTVPDTAQAGDDFNLLANDGGAGAQMAQGSALTVNQREVYASSDVAFWVGDDVDTGAASRIVAGDSITIRGDESRVHDNALHTDAPAATDADPGVGTNMTLRGTIRARTGQPRHVQPDRQGLHPDLRPQRRRLDHVQGHEARRQHQRFRQRRPDARRRPPARQRQRRPGSLPRQQPPVDTRLRRRHRRHPDTRRRGRRRRLSHQHDRNAWIGAHYVVNALDTGAKADGVDTLDVFGVDGSPAAPTDDIFLLRNVDHIPAESSDNPAFVALLHGRLDQARDGSANPASRPQSVQRVNYDANINGQLSVHGGAGNDVFAVDGNSAQTTLDGGAGADTFQSGQLYGLRRTAGNVQSPDTIDTIATTRGYLSHGATMPTTALGGDGDGTFTVYGNAAPLTLAGGNGNDLFTVRAFARAQTDAAGNIVRDGNGVATPLLTAGPDSSVQYNVNAPVSIDGGAGFDKTVAIATEFPDNIVVNAAGVWGAGLDLDYGNNEALEIDAMEATTTSTSWAPRPASPTA